MENKLKKCPQCGCEIASVNTVCPNCSYNFLQSQVPAKTHAKIKGKSKIGTYSLVIGIFGILLSMSKLGLVFALIGICLGIYVLFSKKELYYGTAIVGTVISLIALMISIETLRGGNDSSKENNDEQQIVESTKLPAEDNAKAVKDKSSKPTATPVKKKEWEKVYKNSNIQFVNLKFLSKNAQYYKGQVVISASEAYDIGDNDIQFDTDDSNFFKEVTCRFKNKKEISDLKEKDKVCFIGEISNINTYFGNDTVTIKNCYLVAEGKDVSKYEKKIADNNKQQKNFVSNAKKQQKQAKKKTEKQKKSTYMKKCKSYSYKKIQRHPDKYEGKNIKVSGTVIQVMEGWFDTVSLRVEDPSGNIWYVSYGYSDKEAKILDNDRITIYGECTGTETYTTILGNSQTIPSVDAQYIVR